MRLTVLAAAMALALPAFADQDNIKVFSPGGKGSYKIVSSSSEHQFTGLTFIVLNGSVHISFLTTAGMMAFAGRQELQPSAEEYILLINSLETLDKSGKASAMPASGKCIVHQTTDGMIINKVACASRTDFGPALMDYKGEGRRVHITPIED